MRDPQPAIPAASPAVVFAALGDQTRLDLLIRLSDGEPRSIIALAADTDITRQAVTKHLKVLADAGLIVGSRTGRESRFRYRPEPVKAARDYLDRVAAQWDDVLGRIKALVEAPAPRQGRVSSRRRSR